MGKSNRGDGPVNNTTVADLDRSGSEPGIRGAKHRGGHSGLLRTDCLFEMFVRADVSQDVSALAQLRNVDVIVVGICGARPVHPVVRPKAGKGVKTSDTKDANQQRGQ